MILHKIKQVHQKPSEMKTIKLVHVSRPLKKKIITENLKSNETKKAESDPTTQAPSSSQ